MFLNITVKKNPYYCFQYNYSKEELINLIEKLLLDNENFVSIFKNEDFSFSIYNKIEEESYLNQPIITFSEKDNLINIYLFLKEYIEILINLENLKKDFETQKLKKQDDYRKTLDFLNKKEKDFKDIVYSSDKIKKKIMNEISKIIETDNYECADNFRFAKVGDKYQEYFYNLAKENGCCGFYDRQIYIKGELYLIGFNYGH
jgi:hypothetical protein